MLTLHGQDAIVTVLPKFQMSSLTFKLTFRLVTEISCSTLESILWTLLKQRRTIHYKQTQIIS